MPPKSKAEKSKQDQEFILPREDVRQTTEVSQETALPEIEPSHLVIKSLRPGFRRAGRAWPAEEVTVAVEDFTAEQIEALLAEPLLVVIPLVTEEKEVE